MTIIIDVLHSIERLLKEHQYSKVESLDEVFSTREACVQPSPIYCGGGVRCHPDSRSNNSQSKLRLERLWSEHLIVIRRPRRSVVFVPVVRVLILLCLRSARNPCPSDFYQSSKRQDKRIIHRCKLDLFYYRCVVDSCNNYYSKGTHFGAMGK